MSVIRWIVYNVIWPVEDAVFEWLLRRSRPDHDIDF